MPVDPHPNDLTTSAPRRLPAARRRNQLLDVALEMFGTQGFHPTSMEDIAERAGVTKPVLYQHFPSKGKLYHELIETVGAQLLEAVAAAATAEMHPYQRVLAGFRSYFRFVEERTSAFRLLFGGGAREDDGFGETIRRVEGSIAGTIAGLIDVELPQEHRDLLGFAIVGLAEVTSRQWVLRNGELPPTADGSGSIDITGGPGQLDAAEGDLLAHRLADLVWAGLRSLPVQTQGRDAVPVQTQGRDAVPGPAPTSDPPRPAVTLEPVDP